MKRVTALRGSLLTALVALAVLWLHEPLFGLDRFHVHTLNDQVGYVTTARRLADTGELTSHLIYPAYLDREPFRFYMPGYYWSLAGAYLLFGDQPLTWRVPGLLAFVLGSVCVFLIGRKAYRTEVGLVAALLFVCFPPNVAFAFTANLEPALVAACLLAFCVFIHLPGRLKGILAPLLLLLPFLFRESSALLIVPMLVLLPGGAPRGRRVFQGLLCLVGALVGLGAVYLWQKAEGKLSPPRSWIVEGTPNYADFSNPGAEDIGVLELLGALPAHFLRNASRLLDHIDREFWYLWQPAHTVAILLLVVYALVRGLVPGRGEHDRFALGAGLLGSMALLALLLFHHGAHANITLRHLLFVYPFVATAFAAGLVWWVGCWRERLVTSRPSWPFVVAVVSGLGLAVGVSHASTRRSAEMIGGKKPPIWTYYLESMHHDDRKLLVSPPNVGLDYVLQHYPARWAFVPANDASLRALDARHPIGTLVFRHAGMEVLSAEALAELRLLRIGSLWRDGVRYTVYQSDRRKRRRRKR